MLRMRLKKANGEESPGRLLDALKRIQQQAASTASGQVVRGVTKLELGTWNWGGQNRFP